MTTLKDIFPDAAFTATIEEGTSSLDPVKVSDAPGARRRKVTRLKKDAVSHPAHYTRGKIECIDFIHDQGLGFNRGNAIKYIVRAGYKNKKAEVEDLDKAIYYLQDERKRLLKQVA